VEFDRLFRHNLECVYAALGRPVPDELRHTLISTRPVEPGVSPPSAPVLPDLDGRITRDDEWSGAGLHRVGAAVAMGRAGHGLRQVRFGSSNGTFHVLLETSGLASQLLAGADLAVVFRGERMVRYRVSGGGATAVAREEHEGHGWRAASTGARAAADEAVELAIPLSEIPRGAPSALHFQVALLEGGVELERHPEAAPIAVSVEEVHP
jgi:hypothetical protein